VTDLQQAENFDTSGGAGSDLHYLQIVVSAQNAHLESEQIELLALKGIRKAIQCDIVALYSLENDEDRTVMVKVLSSGDFWSAQYISKLETNWLVNSLFSNNTICLLRQNTLNSDQDIEYTTIDGELAQLEYCIPLVVNEQKLGIIHILSKQDRSISQHEQDVLLSLSNSLANSLFNNHLIRQLRIANADLEANRWELLRSRNTLRALFDSLPSSIYIINKQYELVAINTSRSDRAQNSPRMLVGLKCYKALNNQDEPCQGCLVAETLLQGSTTNRTLPLWVNPDVMIEWDISTYPIRDDQNRPFQAIVIETDVTEKRRLEANLAQSEKLAAVGQLAAGVAHEINNPLAAIIANAQILSREIPDDPDMRESLELIEMAGMRASNVVKNLLGFARKEQLDFAQINLNDTIRTALAVLQHEILSRSVTMRLNLGENMPLLNGNRENLQGVWVNMLLNAMDALYPGRGVISITSSYINREFRVVIADNGQGIPPEKLSHIFEPFYTTKQPGKGTGLGLSICHRTIKQHGGSINVDSQIGKGTTFTIVLPLIDRPSEPEA